MKLKKRIMCSIIICISLFVAILGVLLMTSDKAMAVPKVAVGKEIKSISENTETKLSFADGQEKWLSFTPSESGLYEFFTYDYNSNDPGMFWYKGDTRVGYIYSNSGKDANEYQYMSMSAGQIYYFKILNSKNSCVANNQTISFKVRNVSKNVTQITCSESKCLNVNTDSGTKWIAFTPDSTNIQYRFKTDNGIFELNKEDNENASYNLYSGDYAFTFKKQKQYLICVGNVYSDKVNVSISLIGSNLTGAVDSTTGNRTGNNYNVNSEEKLSFKVSPQAKDKSQLKYKWFDNNDNVLSSTSDTLNYTVTSSVIITCQITDQYLNSINVIYNITCKSVSYSVTVDVKNGNNDITVNGISTGSYSTSKSFSVNCNKACKVFVSKDNGTSYSKLQYSSANGNAHTYYLEINSNIKVVIVKVGDFNMDGKVDSADALQILRVDVNKATAGSLEKMVADIDGNNKLDSADALQVLRADVNKVTLNW